jgi:hypothetical protein
MPKLIRATAGVVYVRADKADRQFRASAYYDTTAFLDFHLTMFVGIAEPFNLIDLHAAMGLYDD